MADPVMDTTAETVGQARDQASSSMQTTPVVVPMVSPALMQLQQMALTDLGYVLGIALGSVLVGGAVGWLSAGKASGGVVGAGALTTVSSSVQLVRGWQSMGTTGKVGLGVIALAGLGVAGYGLWRRGKQR